MIAIIDYGAGNLGSVYKALKHIDTDVVVTSSAAEVARADKLVLPGVGAFAHCMSGLSAVRLADETHKFIRSGRPFLGICVGMQMLFEESEEMGSTRGLGILPGRVVKFRFDATAQRANDPSARLKIPHIGWNSLTFGTESSLFQGLNQGDRVYFVHSYYPEPTDPACEAATAEYGYRFCCAIERDNVFATQFHPEKSGAVGLQILRNFTKLPS
jgi:imidazole glycerol-phosphate synthase subunit HisH